MAHRTVLIVEDNSANRTIFASILQHHGYAVLEAGDGLEGVRLAREQRPDLILMDISLPVLDGLAATAELKRDVATASIPVVAITAHAMREDERRAREAGCEGYLAKPVEPLRVVEEVARLVGDDASVDPAGSDRGLRR